MNKSLSIFEPFNFPKQFNTTVGFEPILKRLAEISEAFPSIPTYPPYNIKKTGENTYVIEMAVAGFGKQDLEIELKDGTLVVKGSVKSDDGDYLVKGIAERAFTRQFTLADSVEVKNADLVNGMLKIWLERFIPEEKQPKKIEIGGAPLDPNAQLSQKQFLSESGRGSGTGV